MDVKATLLIFVFLREHTQTEIIVEGINSQINDLVKEIEETEPGDKRELLKNMIRKFEATIELLNVEPKLEPKAEPGERRILAEILIDD